MNYGLYLSASGALTHLERQNVIANNLANASTVGFKPDLVYTRQRLPERLEGNVAIGPQRMLEMLGGGLAPHGNLISGAQGSLTKTGRDLDLAIEGKGYLLVREGTGDETLRFTRDGRLTLNRAGELVMVVNGLSVLDDNDQPIRLDRALPVEVRENGDVIQGDQVRARLQLAVPRSDRALVKVGGNLLRLRDGIGPDQRAPAEGRLRQGHLESSAVDPIKTLMSLTAAAKAVMANAKMMQFHDHIIGQAVNTLGRVA